jgi:outer membrane lipoprotein-sorting protein
LVDIDVIFTASAVIVCISVLSVFIVGVADDASEVILSQLQATIASLTAFSVGMLVSVH